LGKRVLVLVRGKWRLSATALRIQGQDKPPFYSLNLLPLCVNTLHIFRLLLSRVLCLHPVQKLFLTVNVGGEAPVTLGLSSTPSAMVDPLSVAAGVAGLITVGVQVSQGLVKFYSAYKFQHENVAKIFRKLEKLLNTLEPLDEVLRNRKFKADEAQQLANVEDSIESCKEAISDLKCELDKLGESPEKGLQAAARRTGRKLAYPFRESTLQKLNEDVSDVIDNLLVALGILQLKRVDEIQSDTADMTILMNLLRTSQLSDQVRGWINAPDPSSNYNEACKRRHPRTGLWLVHGLSFQKWLDEDHSFLWLNGLPGCGKTVLSSTAIQHTLRHRRSNPRIGIAFHYFTFTDDAKQNVSGMLRTMLLQLSNQLDDGHAALIALHNTYKAGEPPVQALENTLKQILLKFQDVYVVIDALDESPRGERRDPVLETLAEMHGWLIGGLHILITSRDEADIRDGLSPQTSDEVSMDNKDVDKDIEDYVVQRLRNDPKFIKFASYRTKIETTLIERAHGM
jgi:ankyrin repeat domain-containing protein 50